VVAFLDAGSVSTQVNPDFTQPKFGAGLGLRYNLGFGPLRLDVGTPLNPGKGDPAVQIYISIGQSF
jgi:translocation and assembly module TamA